jgi:hypothetical protein
MDPEEPIPEETAIPPEEVVIPEEAPAEILFNPDLRIIYRLPDNGVAVVTPNASCGLTLEEIVALDVPAGTPHRIVDVSTIPTDRTFRQAWEWVD